MQIKVSSMRIWLGLVRIKLFSHSFSPRTLPSTVREASARKGVASANIVRFGANKGLALKFCVFIIFLPKVKCLFLFQFCLYFDVVYFLPGV